MIRNQENSLLNKKEVILHLETKNFQVKESKISGFGLFSLILFQKNTEIGPALVHKSIQSSFKEFLGDQFYPELKWDYAQTTATRFINHCSKPNLKIYKPVPFVGIIYAKCLENIYPGDEITLNYMDTALIAEDCNDPAVIKYYCEILNLSPQEFYDCIKNYKCA